MGLLPQAFRTAPLPFYSTLKLEWSFKNANWVTLRTSTECHYPQDGAAAPWDAGPPCRCSSPGSCYISPILWWCLALGSSCTWEPLGQLLKNKSAQASLQNNSIRSKKRLSVQPWPCQRPFPVSHKLVPTCCPFRVLSPNTRLALQVSVSRSFSQGPYSLIPQAWEALCSHRILNFSYHNLVGSTTSQRGMVASVNIYNMNILTSILITDMTRRYGWGKLMEKHHHWCARDKPTLEASVQFSFFL